MSNIRHDLRDLLADIHAAAFPEAKPEVQLGKLALEDAASVAVGVVKEHHPNALAAIVCGSAFHGTYAPYSDLDVVIILPSGNFIRNQCFMHHGIPIDLQLFGIEAVNNIIRYVRRSGNSSILRSVTFGRAVCDPGNIAPELQAKFREEYERGPGAHQKVDVDSLRWQITTVLADLCGGTTKEEAAICGLTLYSPLLSLILIQTRSWRSRGRWVARELEPDLLLELYQAYAALLTGSKVEFVRFALGTLKKSGGPLWAGYEDGLVFQYHKSK